MMRIPVATAALLALLAPGRATSVEVGSTAPAVEPTEWLNTKGATTWKDLRGRLVLIEKWATW